MMQDSPQVASTEEKKDTHQVQVFRHPHSTLLDRVVPAAPTVGFAYPTTLEGSTAHFNVYYDPSLGANGQAIADGVLASCENEYNILSFFIRRHHPGTFQHHHCSPRSLRTRWRGSISLRLWSNRSVL